MRSVKCTTGTVKEALETRDSYADARRLAENDRDAKESELADLDAAANGVEQDAARVHAGAVDSAGKLGKRLGQSQSSNPMTKAKAGLGGLSDVAKTKAAFDEFENGVTVRLGPERARLRRDINKLTKDIGFYRSQEAYWQAEADEAESEIEAIAAFEAGLQRSRVRAAWEAWAQDQAAAARAKDNAQSQSQTSGQASSQNARAATAIHRAPVVSARLRRPKAARLAMGPRRIGLSRIGPSRNAPRLIEAARRVAVGITVRRVGPRFREGEWQVYQLDYSVAGKDGRRGWPELRSLGAELRMISRRRFCY